MTLLSAPVSFHRFLHRVENRALQVGGPAFAGGHAAYDIGAVIDHVPGMETADLAGKALYQDF